MKKKLQKFTTIKKKLKKFLTSKKKLQKFPTSKKITKIFSQIKNNYEKISFLDTLLIPESLHPNSSFRSKSSKWSKM